MLTKDVGGVYDVISVPDVRGMGIGTAMTKKSMEYAQKNGKKYAVLTATDSAKYVYEKIGFHATKDMSVYNLV